MNRRLLLVSSALMLSAALMGCDSKESTTAANAPKSAPAKQAPSLEAAAQARGFTVGAMMAANPVYVFFDPQCPHCANLWKASLPLQKSVKFVWIPVALINATSLAQGGALLSAVNPVDAMTEHESSLLAGKGGISASASLPPELEQAIKKNTADPMTPTITNATAARVAIVRTPNRTISRLLMSNATAMPTPDRPNSSVNCEPRP